MHPDLLIAIVGYGECPRDCNRCLAGLEYGLWPKDCRVVEGQSCLRLQLGLEQ